MKIIFYLMIISSLLVGQQLEAQDKYFTKTGSITFFSKAPLENIEAQNNKVSCVLDTKSGQIEFSLLMKAFQFEKALMQEHFNENYVESDKYPKAGFSGAIADVSKVNFGKDGTYPVQVSGDMTIKGVTKKETASGEIVIKGGKAQAKSTFNIQLSDYNVSIPAVVKDNISKTIQISVDLNLEPLKK
jgi:hypothetical protein